MDDLIRDWQATFKPEFQGVKVISDRWSPDSHALRDFLARNQVPYRWLDIENNPEAQHLVTYAGEKDHPCLPLVLLPDGEKLVKPSWPSK